jgi:hypothetical protein
MLHPFLARAAGGAESSELIRQVLFPQNFWKPATDFHSSPVAYP